MTAVTKLSLFRDRIDHSADGTHAFNANERTGCVQGIWRARLDGVRIVAIDAGDMPGWIDEVFGFVVEIAGGENGVGAWLVELQLHVDGDDIAIVTGKTVLFRNRPVQETRFGAGLMRRMTVLARILAHGLSL